MATTNEQLLERAIRHAVFVARFRTQVGNQLVGELEPLLAQVLSKVTAAVDDVQSRGFAVSSRSRKRIQKMLRQVARLTGKKYGELLTSLRTGMRTFAQSEASFQVLAFKQSLPEGIGLGFTTPKKALLNSLVDGRPVLLNRQSGFVREFFGGMKRSFLVDVEGAVNTGLANGETAREIAKRLSGVRGAEGVFGTARRQLVSAARTTVNHVSNQAHELVYAANQDVVKGVKFVATLDVRTTPICRSLDGDVFPIDEGERPPMHHQCRSTTTPVLKSFEELGLGNRFPNAPPASRAALDGVVPGDVTYTQWLRGQPASIQDLALGPGRGKLFRANADLSMRDLLDPLNRPLTLKQLQKIEGVAA